VIAGISAGVTAGIICGVILGIAAFGGGSAYAYSQLSNGGAEPFVGNNPLYDDPKKSGDNPLHKDNDDN